ncbi:2-hydroxyacyl-CoA lyase 2-like [Patiria miniata]|uniref:IlvB-like protein n=1 Tax=Patiria miniata TaxID=46514 RepID=A0A913ZQ76_PATMI|nr:2-hydroxyacyl-CoA lyase 2-like [Patiria miniata]
MDPLSIFAIIFSSIPISILLLVCGLVIYLEKKMGLVYQRIHKADPDSKRHGGELVAETLKAHGVPFLFTLCGGHISPVNVAADKLGIRIIDTRHEASAVFAADAVARLSGKIGVAIVTAGPGLTNTITAVKNAQMAESPVLLMGGAAATMLKGRGALQDIDQMSLFKPLCKFCASVSCVRDIVPTIRKAIYEAQSDTPGPVFVELPIDVLYSYDLVKKELGTSGSKAGILASIVSFYLTTYVNNIFAGAWEQRDVGPLPVHQPMASAEQVQKAVEIVSKAKKPVIVLGSQVTLPPTPVEEVREALEAMGIPCFLGGMARGMLGKNSPYHIRQRRRDALRDADVVILAGTVCDFRLSYGRHLSRRSKVIAVNRNKSQLLKNSDMIWTPTLAIQGDPGTFVASLQKALGTYKCDPEWPQTLKGRDEEKEQANIVKSDAPVNHFLNPLKVLHIMEDCLDEDSILVADGGDFVGSAAYILRPRGPLKWLDPGAFGTLGVGGGFALGAKLCRPDSEVWIIYGDGTLGYTVAEFDTFERHGAPVIAVVGNDASWMQIERGQIPIFGTSVGCQLAFRDYEKVAEGYGGKGFRLSEETPEQIQQVFQEAKKICKDGTPVLINCLVGKTDFRDGSISV